MPNKNGWLSRDEVTVSGKPAFISSRHGDTWEGKWNPARPAGDILLNKSRCSALNAPVRSGEEPIAYVYNNAPSHSYRYVPHYARSFNELDWTKATPSELKVKEKGPRK